jgi:hypothetical protein
MKVNPKVKKISILLMILLTIIVVIYYIEKLLYSSIKYIVQIHTLTIPV